jgi:hypothetical protein
MKRPIATAVAFAIAMSGCATASKDIATSYVSPLQYQSFECDQLSAEAMRIQTRVTQVGGRLDEAAANDQGIMAAGLIVFWPALFFLGGTKQQEAEYARLKGEYDAVQQTAIAKRCAVPPALKASEPKPPVTHEALAPAAGQ